MHTHTMSKTHAIVNVGIRTVAIDYYKQSGRKKKNMSE